MCRFKAEKSEELIECLAPSGGRAPLPWFMDGTCGKPSKEIGGNNNYIGNKGSDMLKKKKCNYFSLLSKNMPTNY